VGTGGESRFDSKAAPVPRASPGGAAQWSVPYAHPYHPMNAVTPDRPQTFGEEVANALSHGLGFLLAVAALPVLVHGGSIRGGAADVVAASLFAGTMIVLYGVSTLYHALPAGRAKLWLNRLDHAAIYLFIAGSYMPFLLGVLWGPGAGRCSAWSGAAAALGVGAKLLNRLKPPAVVDRPVRRDGLGGRGRGRAAARAHVGRRPGLAGGRWPGLHGRRGGLPVRFNRCATRTSSGTCS
jgi:hypothetical protein